MPPDPSPAQAGTPDPPETPGQSSEPGDNPADRVAHLEAELSKTIKQKQRRTTELEQAQTRLAEIEPKLADLETLQQELDEARSNEATARGELAELQRSVRADAFRRELRTKLPEGVNTWMLDAALSKAEADGLDVAPEDATAGVTAAIEHLREHAPQLLDKEAWEHDPFPNLDKSSNALPPGPLPPNGRRV